MLDYCGQDPLFRKWHHDRITFSLLYAFSERFLLPFSHDEVVHGKRSLLSKMPGDVWQKHATLRTLLGYMFVHPGRKLLFMGAEIGQWREWNHDGELDWAVLGDPRHAGLQRWVRDLNATYRACRAAVGRGLRVRGLRLDRLPRPRQQRRVAAAPRPGQRRRWWWRSPTSRRRRGPATASASRFRAPGANASTATPTSTAAATPATADASRPSRSRDARPRAVAGADHPAAGIPPARTRGPVSPRPQFPGPWPRSPVPVVRHTACRGSARAARSSSAAPGGASPGPTAQPLVACSDWSVTKAR